jgi:hypothetical protein
MDAIGTRQPAEAPGAKRSGARPTKPGVAFKQELARAMEGWGPDALASALRGAGPGGVRTAGARPVTMVTALPSAQPPATPRTDLIASPAFRTGIARLESGPAGAAGGGHSARNPASGALGRYQMLPVALRDIGWQDANGGWTAAAAGFGVLSEQDFLANPAAQEAAMDAYLRRKEVQLDRNGSLARAGGSVTGLDGAAVPLTQAGLVAAAHRRGAHSVARYLAHRTDTPEAALTPADRQAYAAVERRLRDFAQVPYALAAAPGPRRVGTG